ncbi:hypothetical protein DFR58_10458 [Anaerobacterium chartisolvens]|uniref:Uncharacterized protein n=1 Tax=Anaerobacterium chartisolvens TaxID=1297424 RepID=A0A369BB81_9FIRM|nr:hypothetical protein [Anaerobacterium chartisolvens]RCX18789.1 hypothetical protein DFR58_10458 [Anaerobacterium chartisolvens]
MPYRKKPLYNKKYTYSGSLSDNYRVPENDKTVNTIIKESFEKNKDIPLPNEKEIPDANDNSSRGKGKFSLMNIIESIRLEEIILIGLIFLLISEGLNGIEDEFLLLILIYILFV